jgi:hypothetical protein
MPRGPTSTQRIEDLEERIARLERRSIRVVAGMTCNPKSGSWMIARWHRIGGNQRDGDRNDGSGSSPEG